MHVPPDEPELRALLAEKRGTLQNPRLFFVSRTQQATRKSICWFFEIDGSIYYGTRRNNYIRDKSNPDMHKIQIACSQSRFGCKTTHRLAARIIDEENQGFYALSNWEVLESDETCTHHFFADPTQVKLF